MTTNNEKERNDLQDKNLVKLEINIERLEFALKKVDGSSKESSELENVAGSMMGGAFADMAGNIMKGMVDAEVKDEDQEDGEQKNHKVESFNRDLE